MNAAPGGGANGPWKGFKKGLAVLKARGFTGQVELIGGLVLVWRTPNSWPFCWTGRPLIAGTRRLQTRLPSAGLRHSQDAIDDVEYRTPRRL